VRVLELGWEFPPRISGGLGTACEGIVRGLRANGVDVLLVLPRLVGGEEAAGATLLAADELERALEGRRPRATHATDGGAAAGALDVVTLPSALRPYQSAGDYTRTRAKDELHAGAPRPADGPCPPSRAALSPMQGGYGPNLAAEVERYARVVADLAQHERFDVIHAHDWMTFPAGLAAREASGKPLVVHVHSSEWDRCGNAGDPAVRAIEAAGLASADLVVCVSHFTRKVLERHYSVDPERVRVVHNAVRRRVPVAGSPTHGASEVKGATGEPPTVLFLGRLTRQKGPAFFLEAAHLVHAARPDVRFLVAGDGDLKSSLVESSALNGLARNVFFTGFLAPEDVERAYAAADLYVMPSVSEPFGIAPLEALSLDVPVIVSRQSGVAETLPSAPKIDYWDVRDLAGKVLLLLDKPDLRRALVESGRRDIERLRWETNGARLVLAFGEVLRGAQRGAAGRSREAQR
jgi:glycogen(starch) synthase